MPDYHDVFEGDLSDLTDSDDDDMYTNVPDDPTVKVSYLQLPDKAAPIIPA